ncbi:MAG: winged helix-turn-helix domain-containing protein [Anaerolineales bacterium]|nr:winged helix-turn-helix domain-containing protein [Anaerolineales bacterium]
MSVPFQSLRQTYLTQLLGILARSECAAVYGLSNTGKSLLLRALPAPQHLAEYARLAGRPGLLVYVDCNRVVELTATGFFEVVVRSLIETLEHDPQIAPELINPFRHHHDRLTTLTSAFQASLAFNNAVSDACTQLGHNVVLMFDEFDEIYTALEERTLLNLRALKDKFQSRLAYVTATTRPLTDPAFRKENEFAELFTINTLPLRLLSEADARCALRELGGERLPLETQRAVLAAAGGHFGLLHTLVHAAQHQPGNYANDPNVRAECLKIWNQLRPDEQAALKALATRPDDGLNPHDRTRLGNFGLIGDDGRIFSELFAAFVRHQATLPEQAQLGVQVDEDAGEVWVEGVRVTVLTDLEYRLMRLLYQRRDRLTTKEQIVESVWGGQYLDKVDDARIEKLVSRLRAKIEPEPLRPRYLLTQRGRGYKLVSRPAEDRANDDEA